jgi:hypothetical protein
LITIRCADRSSFVIVQVFVWPAEIVPLQPLENDASYPEGPLSVTL